MSYPVELSPREHRLASIDLLRGAAVLGILVMNVYAFAMPWVAYANPLAMGGDGLLDLGTWFVTHVLFDQKFMAIFSMLFGAGIVLMSDRADAAGAGFASIFFRRQGWLLLIGLVHAYFLWFGDILFMYAVVGMLAFFFRRRSTRTLVLVACLLLPVSPLLGLVGGTYIEELSVRVAAIEERSAAGETPTDEEQAMVEQWAEVRSIMAPSAEDMQRDVDAYTGSYPAMVRHRAPFVASFHREGLLFFALWRVGGLMLLGMALYRSGVLQADRDARFYAAMAAAGYAIGLPLTVFSAIDLNAHGFDPIYVFRVGGATNYFGSVFVALGHVGLVLFAFRRGWLPGLARRLAAVGRMALSNYLTHSLVLTTVFYGYGLALYGAVARSEQMLFVAALAGLQLLISPWWLARFRFGPAEWLWRTLTYGQVQPFRR